MPSVRRNDEATRHTDMTGAAFLRRETQSRTACLGALALTVMLLLLAALRANPVHAQDATYSADSVKAAFLYHFAGYVEWPESRSNAPLVIGVVGDAGVSEELRRILPGRTIGNRGLRVRDLEPAEDFTGVDILYIARPFMPVLSRAANQRYLLIVTDEMADGLESGAIINFVNVDRRIRFEISMRAADQAGLRLSARLLSAALRVRRTQWDVPTSIAAHLPVRPRS
jgi:hypothetical protein